MGRVAENIEKKDKTGRRKTKNENKVKRRMQGKSNNNNEHLWFIFYAKNIYFVQKHSTKSKKVKVVYTITFYLQFLSVAEYLNRSNDTQKLNIHK